MAIKKLDPEVAAAYGACVNVLQLIATPALFARWRERTPGPAIRQTLLDTIDHGLAAIPVLRADPTQGGKFIQGFADSELQLRAVRRRVETWDPATAPDESLFQSVVSWFTAAGYEFEPEDWGELSTWPDTGEPLNLTSYATAQQDMDEFKAHFERRAKVKEMIAEMAAGRLSGAAAARALFPDPVLGACLREEWPIIGRALGEEGVRALFGDNKSMAEALVALLAAERERIVPVLERLGPVAVEILAARLEESPPLFPELKLLADPAYPTLLVRVMRALVKVSTKTIRELPPETLSRAAELLVAQKAWFEVWKLLSWFKEGTALDKAARAVVEAWESDYEAYKENLELLKAASLSLRREVARDRAAFEAKLDALEAPAPTWRVARYQRALLDETGDTRRALKWMLGLIAAGNGEAEGPVDGLGWALVKQGTPEQVEALVRAGTESPVFRDRVRDWKHEPPSTPPAPTNTSST